MTSALYVHTYGPADGGPVIALHGITGHGARWRRFVEEELPGHRVHAPDLRGHGHSPQEPPWGLEQHAQDVIALLRSTGDRPADLVGHSFGGAVALHVVNAAPELVRRLVLLDPAIGLPPESVLAGARGFLDVPSYATREAAVAARTEAWPLARPGVVAEEAAEHLAEQPDGTWRWRYEQAVIVTAYSEMARPHVTPPPAVPSLLVSAGQAAFVQPGFVADCRTALGDRFTAVELDAGHMLYIDRPAATGALVREFLADGADSGTGDGDGRAER